MGSKRRRSVDNPPLPATFGAHMHMHVDSSRHTAWDFASASRVKCSDWGNRTRKRFRDNRPDEHAVHQNTLQKLFSAQRNPPDASPVPAPIHQPALALSKPQKSTLHSFWKQLPAPPVQPAFAVHPPLQSLHAHPPRCDDCDTPLQSVNHGMHVDMDMGGAVESHPFACIDCGKHVCGTCAVVSTQRHCLQCATSGRNSRPWW